MKLQLSYEIMFGYEQKLQIVHLIPLKTIKFVSYNKFFKPGQARLVFRLNHLLLLYNAPRILLATGRCLYCFLRSVL